MPEFYLQTRRFYNPEYRPSTILVGGLASSEILLLLVSGFGINLTKNKLFNILQLTANLLHGIVEVVAEYGYGDVIAAQFYRAWGIDQQEYLRRFDVW